MPPWEKYQSPSSSDGPWAKYAAPVDVSVLQQHTGDLDYKMATAGAKQAESFPQYAGRFIKEGVLPTAGGAAGSVIGGLPGAMAGAALGETVSQATGLTPAGSVIPEANKPDLGRVAVAGAMQGVVPLAIAGGKRLFDTGKSMLEPFYQSGREAIIGRTLNTAAGGQQAQAIQALRNANELVPGSLPTVGQGAQNAGLASLERAASSIDPTVTNAFASRLADQNAARTGVIRSIAGTDADRVFAEQARKTHTAPLLEALKSSQAPVDPSRTVSLIDNLIEQAPGRTQLTNTLKQVRSSLFDESGSLRANASQLYQGARKNLTDLLNQKAGDGSKLNEAISRELTVVMKSLDNQIGKAEPAYKQFLADYAEMSKPINRMDVGREIEQKSINKLTDTLQPNAYANALSDKTAQRATGFKRATLEGTMTPEQLAKLQAVKEDLARALTAEKSAGTVGSDTVKKLAYSNLIDRAGVPTFLREFAPTQAMGNILARGADAAYGSANRELSQQLAMTLLDPRKAASLMGQAVPSRMDAMIAELLKRGTPFTGAAAAQLEQERRQP